MVHFRGKRHMNNIITFPFQSDLLSMIASKDAAIRGSVKRLIVLENIGEGTWG